MSSDSDRVDTGQLYDEHASRWQRRAPSSLSDFTGRPAIFELCEPVAGRELIDLGCGEGYCARELASRGAGAITGVELSPQMVQLAQDQEHELQQGIHYRQGDITTLEEPDASFDLAIGVFVYNYLNTTQMLASFKEVQRVLRPGGHFVFSVPHPAFAFIQRSRTPPFYFDLGSSGYFSGRNQQFQGEIARRDGTSLPVQMVHKTISDYFTALQQAGFRALPEVHELAVKPEHLQLDRAFFSPVADLPLHLAFRIAR